MARKYGTNYPGVRYREHKSRLHANRPDRCFFIRHKREERVGWASDGWNARKAADILATIRHNNLTGDGPQSLRDIREAQKEARAQQAAEKLKFISLATLLNEHFLPYAKRRKRTWRDDAYRIKRINKHLGHLPLPEIAPEHLAAFKAWLEDEKGLAPGTVLQYLGLIRSAFNFAVKTRVDGVLLFDGANPVTSIELPKPRGKRERFLSPAEVDTLVHEAAGAGWLDLRDAIVLSVNTGMRYGEIVRLEWSDVDLRHGIITVRQEENRKPGGPCYINAEARAILEARERTRTEARVLPPVTSGFIKNESIYREDISKQFAKLVKRTGLNRGVSDTSQRVVFHTLRHTFASWLALNGTDIFRIRTLMRHETIAMTMRYAHLIPNATRGAVENIRPAV